MSADLYYNKRRFFETTPYGIQYYWDDDPSYASSTTSDSAVATSYALKVYAEKLSDRMYENNVEDIDKDYVAGMIYAILMKDDVDDVIKDRLLADRPGKEKLFKDEDFLI
jgi:hypothetical protein